MLFVSVVILICSVACSQPNDSPKDTGRISEGGEDVSDASYEDLGDQGPDAKGDTVDTSPLDTGVAPLTEDCKWVFPTDNESSWDAGQRTLKFAIDKRLQITSAKFRYEVREDLPQGKELVGEFKKTMETEKGKLKFVPPDDQPPRAGSAPRIKPLELILEDTSNVHVSFDISKSGPFYFDSSRTDQEAFECSSANAK